MRAFGCVGGWAGCCFHLELMKDCDQVRQKREDYPATVWQVGRLVLPPVLWWTGGTGISLETGATRLT